MGSHRDSSSVASENRFLSADDDTDEISHYSGRSYPDSELASITSSVYGYVEENGRTYHGYKRGEGKYELPNDETEQNRLDLQHHLFRLTINGRLGLAPLDKDAKNVLDICTGTGIWAIEYALQFPDVDVVGSDLSPIQPEYLPTNCRFVIEDAEDDWEHPVLYDYIHGRQTFTCFHSVPAICRKAYDALKPGGWFEMQDMTSLTSNDGTLKNTSLELWNTSLVAAGEALGKDWNVAPKYKKYFEDAGFIDVHERVYSWPINTWPKGAKNKEIGKWCHANLQDALQAVSLRALTAGLGWSTEQVEELLAKCSEELKDRRIHAYYPIYFVYGRKPYESKDL